MPSAPLRSKEMVISGMGCILIGADRENIGDTINDQPEHGVMHVGNDSGAALSRLSALRSALAGQIDDRDHRSAQAHHANDIRRRMWRWGLGRPSAKLADGGGSKREFLIRDSKDDDLEGAVHGFSRQLSEGAILKIPPTPLQRRRWPLCCQRRWQVCCRGCGRVRPPVGSSGPPRVAGRRCYLA